MGPARCTRKIQEQKKNSILTSCPRPGRTGTLVGPRRCSGSSAHRCLGPGVAGQSPQPSPSRAGAGAGCPLSLLPVAPSSHTHTHHFSLSSPGEGAPVDFSNPSSLFPIIVCEPRGTAAIDSPRLCCDARNQLGSLPLPGAALGWEQVWGTLGDQSLWGGCERRYRPHGFI